MRASRVDMAAGVLAIAAVCAGQAGAQAPVQPHRWIAGSDVALYAGANVVDPVQGTIPRGTEVVLTFQQAGLRRCLVESTTQNGYVDCSQLSATPVARERAGENGVAADIRWVTGTGVVLRVAADPRATALERIGLNRRVHLRAPAAGEWCDVRTEQGATGFIACRYLADEPFDLAAISTPTDLEGRPNPHYDPARLYWMQPGWWAMEAYATLLAQRHRDAPAGGRWPRDAELERMKADLANGHVAAAPAPMPDWTGLRDAAATVANAGSDDPRRMATGYRVQEALGLWYGDGESALALMQALALPRVRASYFGSEKAIAPGGADAEALGGRFGIVQRWTTTPRPQPAAGEEAYGSAGLYDMLARTQSLVRPVQRVRLFRDGALQSAATHARRSEVLHRDTDGPECEGFVGGFAFGDADPGIWDYYDADYGDDNASTRLRAEAGKPVGLLYEFYVPGAAPAATSAAVAAADVVLDRAATGFVGGRLLAFDLDRDDVPDLAVFEGRGHGPGHLGGETTTDDAWYRAVFVNIAGRWKILGSDSFAYGCGC